MASSSTPLMGADDVQKEIGYGTSAARKRKPVAEGLPKSVNAKNVDGKHVSVNLMPKSALFAMAEPPGGWHGPFGFLRMVAISFLILSGIMCLAFVYAVLEGDNLTSIVFCLVLAGAALMAAFAAYSHEGLANQVTKMARHNNEYSSLNDGFDQQTKDLANVTARVNDLLQGNEMKLEEFKKQMSQLDQLSALNQVSTVTRSFIDAEMKGCLFSQSGEALDGMLTKTEVLDFIRGAKSTLQDRIPKFDMDDLAKAAYFPGMCLMDITLLLAAVASDSDEETSCFMALLYFILHPRKPGTIQEVTRALKIHFKDHPTWGVEKKLVWEIARLVNTTPEEGTDVESDGQKRREGARIPVGEARQLARDALHTFSQEDDDDLGISDDED